VHPDEQIEMLRRAKQEREKGERNGPAGRQPVRTTDATASDEAIWEPKPQREWVLPTDLREEWTLRRLAAVFAGIGPIPPRLESSGEGQQADDEDEAKWRATKRLLLAAIQSDSTIVYYVVHDGIVKPRTN
jgi:tRNA-splicing endonuclease subunit Sen15